MKIPLKFYIRSSFTLINRILTPLTILMDIILIPFTFLGGIFLLPIRKLIFMHFGKMAISKEILRMVGVFPIADHYHEPAFDFRYLRSPFDEERFIAGIDFNIEGQLKILRQFNYNEELEKFPMHKGKYLEYFYMNYSFVLGDSEYLYNIIRFFKPKKIIEVGSGFSTLMAINAIRANIKEDSDYRCDHICIEPFENRWLEGLDVNLITKRVEELDRGFFSELNPNDILFIDSSHVIKPQGDVLFEYLEILPTLKSGVLVQIHDIYTPRDYPERWITGQVKFWNEQYILESFLVFNPHYEIIGALNFLRHNYFSQLSDKCPALKRAVLDEEERGGQSISPPIHLEPSSFWIRKK
jgi:hypothetical protein